jgi:hypothetical protein
MAPILGIYASQISGHLFAPSGAYDSIATTTVGSGGTASITFDLTGVSGYTHLQIRGITRAATAGTMWVRFNGVTTSSYSWHYVEGDGANPNTGNGVSDTRMFMGRINTASDTANAFSTSVLDILDYANTNKTKVIRSLDGNDTNGSGNVGLYSGMYNSTNAITSVTIAPQSGNWNQYTTFALYGIKGN